MDKEYVYTERFYQHKLTSEDILNYKEFLNKQANKLTALKMARNRLEKYDYNKSRMGQTKFFKDVLSTYGINSKEDFKYKCRFDADNTYGKNLLVFIDNKYIGTFIFKEEVISKLDDEYTEVEYTMRFIEDYKEDK